RVGHHAVEITDRCHHCAPGLTAEVRFPESGSTFPFGRSPNHRPAPPEPVPVSASTSALAWSLLSASVTLAWGTLAFASAVVLSTGPELSTRTFWKRTPTPLPPRPFCIGAYTRIREPGWSRP